MRRTGREWDPNEAFSFWALATPQEGARALVEVFGDTAAAKAAWLACYARDEGEDADYRFWTAVYARLCATGWRQAGGGRQ